MNVDYFKSALLHHSKGNWNKAKEIYEHILKTNPNDYSVLQNYGPLLCQLKEFKLAKNVFEKSLKICLLYTSPSPRDRTRSRMPSSA